MKKTWSGVLGLGIAIGAGTAIPQAVPSLSDRLLDLSRRYGDAQGHIPITTSSGRGAYVATTAGQNAFSIYTVGDRVADDATLAVCSIGATGALVGCDPTYGETMLYGLEDLQSAERDPRQMKITCQVVFGDTRHCKATWMDGGASCYTCSGGACAKTHC